MSKTIPTPKQKANTDTHDHTHDHTHTPSILGENIKFEITIPWKEVQKAYDLALKDIASTVEMKGFRKGKAPIKLVEEKVGKTKIYEESVSRVLSPAYTEEVKKRGIRPIVEPHVHPKSLEEGKDWVFEVETAEAPEVKVRGYKEKVLAVKPKTTIILPGKDEKPATEEEKLRTIFQALLEHTHVRVPEILVRNETSQALSRLVQQLDRLHVTLEDYVKSTQKTIESLRQEYAVSALTSLQLEFILAEISKEEKLEVTNKEIDGIIAAMPDENLRKTSEMPGQRAYIASTLLRRKTVEFLLNL